MLTRLRKLQHLAPRGARFLAQQDAVTPYRELAGTTAAQREVSARVPKAERKPLLQCCSLPAVAGLGRGG